MTGPFELGIVLYMLAHQPIQFEVVEFHACPHQIDISENSISVHYTNFLETEKKSVPMDSDIIWDMINNFDHQSVTFPSNNPRAWEFPIDGYYAFRFTQPCYIMQPYL